MKRLLFFLMAIVFAIQGWTQGEISIGANGTGTALVPINHYYNYNYSQMLYDQSSLTPGTISAIKFKYSAATGYTVNPVVVYMKTTTKSSFSSSTDFDSVGLVQVYSGSVTSATGWVTITLTTPYVYDGTGNLLIAVDNNYADYDGSSTSYWNNLPTTVNKTINAYSDTYNTDPLNPNGNAATKTVGQYIPSLTVVITPTDPGFCFPPTNLASSNILIDGAQISWNSNANVTSYSLEYKTNSQTWAEATVIPGITGTTYTLTNLNSNTLYNVKVTPTCSSSLPSTITFRTACGIISSLPYSESFDNYGTGSGVFLTCWGRLTSTPTTYPYISTTNSSSPGSMYMYTASGAYNYIATPQFDASIPINTLSAFFKLYKSSAAYNITVGVMSDPANMATFDSITNLTPTTTSTWQTYGVNFTNYTGTGQYIAFKVQGYGATNAMYIDDLVVRTTPACSIPTGLTVYDSLSTPNSMELDWNGADDANVLSWIVEYKPIDSTSWQSTEAFSHPFSLTGLQSGTVYQIRIYAICTSGDTTYSTPTINSGLPCEVITSIPWSEGFENVWIVAAGLNTGTHPWCWTNINGGASTTYLWRKTTTASYIHSGTGALQMYTGSTTSQLGDWFISPTISLNGNERLRFWAKGYSTYTDILSVKILDVTTNGIVDANADTSLFVTIMPNTIIPASTWTEYEINLSQYTGDYQIAFVRNTTGGYYLNIDDVSITELPSCIRPSNIAITSLESTLATISWTPGNSADASWYLYYKASTATNFDSVLVSTNPYQLQGLTQLTTYNYYLKTDCGYMLSEPTTTLSFTTPCDAVVTFPYTQAFDSLGTTSGAFPSCWIRPVIYNSYPQTSVTASRVHSTPASLEIHSAVGAPTYAITPPMGVDINTLRVRFWAMAESITSSGTLEVGVMSDPANPLTFESVQIIQPANTSYNQYEVLFSGTTLTGANKFIAFRQNTVSSAYYYWIDDVEVDNIPACSKPASVLASNITTTDATITWSPANATDAAWWLYYKTSTATSYDSVYVTGTPSYSFTTLSPNTLYNIYLKTDCSTELSEATTVTNFRTACTAISSLPWSENFDTYGTGSTIFPSCWNKITTYSTYPYISTTYSSAPGALYFYTSSGTYNVAVSPIIDASIPVNTLMASFKLRKSNATSNITVGVMTDPTNVSTFDSITTVSPSTTGVFEQFEVNLSSYTGAGQYIAFKVAYNTTTNYIYLDDLIINTIPTCPNTYSLSVASATSSDITLNWSSLNSSGQGWEISYGAVGTGFDPSTGTIIPVADAVGVPPYTIPGLTPSTPYSFAVRQACGGNWSNIVTMNTMGLPAVLPYTCDFEDVNEQNSWSISNGGATNKWFIGTAVSATPITGNSLYISSDNGVSNVYNDGSTSTVVASRLIEFSGAGGYTLTFNSRLGGESSFDYIKVYVVDQDTTYLGDASTPYYGNNSYSTGVVLFNGTNPYFNNTSNPTTVNNHTIALPYQGVAGTVKKLMFVWRNDVSSSTPPPASIDNISITPITCAAPSLTISNISQTSADASWTSISSDTGWWLYLKQASATNYDSVYVTGTPSYSFTTLTSNTAYNAYVRLDCGTDLSSPSVIVNFRTSCAAISTLPYTENFDTYGTGTPIFPSCWTRINTSTTTYPYISSTYSHSASGSLYFYAASGIYNIAILPEIDASIPVNTLKATFWMRKSNATTNIIVGVMDSLNASSFTPIDTVAPVATSTWEELEVNFNSYTGTGKYIAFKSQYNTATNYFYLDDVVIDYIPSCLRPTAITATGTGTSMNVSFTPGNLTDNAWYIYYKPATSTTWDSVYATSIPTSIPNLTLQTTYQIFVKTVCGDGTNSNASSIITYTTPCYLNPINTFPFTEGFENGLTCWAAASSGTAANYFWQTQASGTDPSCSPHGGSTLIRFNSYSISDGSWATIASPALDFTTDMKVSFWMYKSDNYSTNYAEGVRIFVNSTPDTVGATLLGHVRLYSAIPQWDSISYQIPTGTLGTKYIIIKGLSEWGDDVYLDDVTVFVSGGTPCPDPTSVLVQNVTTTTADVSWTAGGSETSWEVRLGTTGTPVSVTSPTYPLTGLTPGTNYTVYVRANCGTGYSAWVASAPFTTIAGQLAPVVTTSIPSGVTQYAATLNGSYVQGTDAILVKGFEHKLSTSSTWIIDTVTAGTTPFVFSLNNLTSNTQYDVRAFVFTSTEGTTYGITRQFTTLAVVPPTVVTSAVTNIQQTTATFNGTTAQGTDPINGRGFEYKLTATSTWTGALDITATGTATITAPAINLTANTQYDVRAYVIIGTTRIYGNVVNFTTLQNVVTPPTVVTSPVSNLAQYSVTLNGTVTQGAEAITSQGFEWKLASATTWTRVPVTGTLTYNLPGLTANTAYQCRAYAETPSASYTYGATVNFTTLPIVPTTVVTSPASNITQTSADLNGTVTQGTNPVLTQGFEWRLANTTTWTRVPVTGTTLTYNLPGLTASTSYEYRAYATTAIDTMNGLVVNFTTLAIPVVLGEVTTLEATDSAAHSATLNGILVNVGNALSNVKVGFVYSTMSNPMIGGTNVITDTVPYTVGMTAFSKSIVGLQSNTSYFFKAYVTNSAGTKYGDEKTFITLGLVNPENQGFSVSMYPNPATNTTKLVVSGVVGETKIVISDVQGRTINTINAKSVNGVVEETIDVNNLAKGVYYVRIQNSTTSRTQKLIVQ